MDIRQLQAEEKSYEESIESVKAVEQKRNELVSKYNSFLNTDLGRLDRMIPNTIDNVRLAAEINGIAQQYDIAIKNVRIVENKGNNSSSGRGATEARQPDIYKTILMSFVFDASFEKFTDFVKDLEQSLRIIDLSSISFEAGNDKLETAYSVTLKLYWLP
jgi:hypothetical protein